MVESTDAESILDIMLRESCAFSLDAAVFSNTAASSSRPAGLMAGLAPLTPAAASATALLDDLSALACTVAQKAGGLAYAMSAKQAAAVRIQRGALWPDVPIWSSIAIPDKTVVALDPAAVVSAFGSNPEVRASREAVAHFEDT